MKWVSSQRTRSCSWAPAASRRSEMVSPRPMLRSRSTRTASEAVRVRSIWNEGNGTVILLTLRRLPDERCRRLGLCLELMTAYLLYEMGNHRVTQHIYNKERCIRCVFRVCSASNRRSNAFRTHRLGRVEDGNTASDYDPEEHRRQTSLQWALVPGIWKDTKSNVIDSPGTPILRASKFQSFALRMPPCWWCRRRVRWSVT